MYMYVLFVLCLFVAHFGFEGEAVVLTTPVFWQLEHDLSQVWRQITQEMIQNYIRSMRQQCKVINTNGGTPKYQNDMNHLKAAFANMESRSTVTLPVIDNG